MHIEVTLTLNNERTAINTDQIQLVRDHPSGCIVVVGGMKLDVEDSYADVLKMLDPPQNQLLVQQPDPIDGLPTLDTNDPADAPPTTEQRYRELVQRQLGLGDEVDEAVRRARTGFWNAIRADLPETLRVSIPVEESLNASAAMYRAVHALVLRASEKQ